MFWKVWVHHGGEGMIGCVATGVCVCEAPHIIADKETVRLEPRHA